MWNHWQILLSKANPRKFDYVKPLKEWRKGWPLSYHRVLAILREKWPGGQGVQEFVGILQLHQTYPAAQMEQAIEEALTLGCVHLDGILSCLHRSSALTPAATFTPPDLDLSHRPDLEAIGRQPIDLSIYDQLLKQSW